MSKNLYQYHGTKIYDSFEKLDKRLSQNLILREFCDFLIISSCSLILFSAILFLMRLLVNLTKKNINNNKNIPFELEKRMKYYEEQSRKLEIVPNDKPFIIRLDGRAFNNFTKKYKQFSKSKLNVPYSKEFKNAMLLTASDLLREFKCATAYTHSDEITLIFNNTYLESQYLFDGRVFKLLSLIPSFACGSFMVHFSEELMESGIVLGNDNFDNNSKNNKISRREKIMNKLMEPNKIDSIPTFDARIIVFPEEMEYEIVNHMIWRSKGDCTRNFISLYAETYLGKRNIIGMSNLERLEKLKELGYDLNSENIDYSLKHGTFLKYNSLNNEVEFYVFRNLSFTNDMYEFLTEKHNYELPHEQQSKLSMLLYNQDSYDVLFDF
jgi:tRNA(His) 5'-end guanylyltransferase